MDVGQGSTAAREEGKLRIIAPCAALAPALLVALLAGCVAGSGYDLPEPIVAEEMPGDAAAVAAALFERLRGRDLGRTEGVRFDQGAGANLGEKGFAYEAFSVTDHALLRHGARDETRTDRVAAGLLELADSHGRRTKVLYYADYRLADGGIVVTEARATTLYSTFPEPLMFVVPAETVARMPGHLRRTQPELLSFVAANAVPWKTRGWVPRGKRDYVIFVFLMDRISPSAELAVKIAEERSGKFGFKDSSKYLDFDGWRVGSVLARFDLAGSKLFVKVVFRPGEEVSGGFRSSQLVGLFPLDVTQARKQLSRALPR